MTIDAPTEDVLDMVWTLPEGQEMRKGVLAYGIFASSHGPNVVFPADRWADGTEFSADWLKDEKWVVLQWSILPARWPDADSWCCVLEATLRAFLDAGALVAWCALEGYFAHPPKLLDPDGAPNEIYAAMSRGKYVCSARLGERYTSLAKDNLQTFMREINDGLGLTF